MPLYVGSDTSGCHVVLDDSSISPRHAKLEKKGDDYYVTNLAREGFTYRNDEKLSIDVPRQLSPGDCLEFRCHLGQEGFRFKVKMRHVSKRDTGLGLPQRSRMLVGATS